MYIENLEIYNLESEKNGAKVPFDTLMKDFFPDKQKANQAFLATDMDGTMFKEDLGVLVFLEKLSNPKIWDRFSIDGLNRLLLPKEYKKGLEAGAEGHGWKGLEVETCKHILALKEDIINLYKVLKNVHKDKKSKHDLNIKNPLVNEFARKMIEFDQQMINLDYIFAAKLDGLFLMRTRFFTGLTNDSIKRFTKNLFEENKKDLILKSYDENKNEAKQIITLDSLEIPRTVHTVKDVRSIIYRFVIENKVKGKVITTNLQDIAEEVLESSDYLDLKSYDFGVVGQKLHKNHDQTFRPTYQNKPIFGQRKEILANHVAEKHNRKLLCAFGDSPTNDGLMIKKAVLNGGFGVLVGKDFDTIRSRFDRLINELTETTRKDVLNRIILIETDLI